MTLIAVGILGATGTVGQRFIELLQKHPLFYIQGLGASPKSAGKPYKDVVSWKMTTPIPDQIQEMVINNCDPEYFKDCKVIFSGLDASVAGKVELDFLNSNFVVFSNAKNHRMNPLVPLIVPTVNSDHLVLIDKQRQQFKTDGFLVTNANCSTTGLVVALKALQERFGTLSKVVVTTMQSVSGAGFLILIKVIRGSHL